MPNRGTFSEKRTTLEHEQVALSLYRQRYSQCGFRRADLALWVGSLLRLFGAFDDLGLVLVGVMLERT